MTVTIEDATLQTLLRALGNPASPTHHHGAIMKLRQFLQDPGQELTPEQRAMIGEALRKHGDWPHRDSSMPGMSCAK